MTVVLLKKQTPQCDVDQRVLSKIRLNVDTCEIITGIPR